MYKQKGALVIFMIGFSVLEGAALGSQITFTTQAGASDSDGSLSARAIFTTSLNTLQIQLFNDIANIVSDGQALSGLEWTFNNSDFAASISSRLR